MIKNNIKYLAIFALGLVACEPEFDNPIDESGIYTSGEADFSKFVALGNSLTAGFADNALYITGQENSFPNILAQQFSLAGGGEFTQPLMNDNVGGFVNDPATFPPRLVLAFDVSGNAGPALYTGGSATTDFTSNVGTVNNLGVPGAKSFHLGFEGYGALNPYFGRFASSANATVLGDAIAQDPTFFTLWIGNNDILAYATSGGTGVDQTGNPDPSTYASNDITDPTLFDLTYNGLVGALAANGAKGVVLNLPDVTSLPFFTTVPNNALVLDAATAASLTGFFQAFAGIATQALIGQGVSPAEAQAIAAQYLIEFTPGPNRFLIQEVSPTNPFGFRQMTDEELLVLTIDQAALAQGYGSVVLTPEVLEVLGILQAGGTPTLEQGALVLGAVSAINDADALDATELAEISAARTSFNATIKAAADANGIAFLDIASVLNQAANGGIPFDGGTITSDFVTGGGFSLDGVHPTPRAHALVANGIIQAIERTYGANLPQVNPGDYGTVTLSNDVN